MGRDEELAKRLEEAAECVDDTLIEGLEALLREAARALSERPPPQPS